MKTIDWTKIYQKYQGFWVGLKEDQKTIVSYGKTVKEVMQKAEEKGYKEPILFKVPSKIVPFVGIFR